MTEAEALTQIRVSSEDWPAWQRDALRRLVQNRSLQLRDVEELQSICLGRSEAVVFRQEHVRVGDGAASAVTLTHISNVQHVNALQGDQRLTFHRVGLTIVYGDNGSGKSGYSRVLRNACRARVQGTRAAEISSDIYSSVPGIPAATIEFTVNDANRSFQWRQGQESSPDLANVSVFDSNTANVQLDAHLGVAYTPFPLAVLANLADACKNIKANIAADMTRLKAQRPRSISEPTCTSTSAVGRLIAGLTHATDPAVVECLATMSPDDAGELTQLTADLADDPTRVSRRLNVVKERLEAHLARLEGLSAAISAESVSRLRKSLAASEAASAAAAQASQTGLESDWLRGTGSESWKVLWEAARNFSEAMAYREHTFPATHDGAKCVLCQQTLDVNTSRRFEAFERFVANATQRRASEAQDAHAKIRKAFRDAALSSRDAREILLHLTHNETDERAQALHSQTVRAMWRHRRIAQNAKPIEAIDDDPIIVDEKPIRAAILAIEQRVRALSSSATSAERAKMVAAKQELDDRRWLQGIKQDVLDDIAQRGEIGALERALQSTTTNKITSKSTELAQALVTDAWRARFAQEAGSCGVAGLAVELRQSGSANGVARFKVALTRRPDASLGTILSEGEYRCVALAAFLAELVTERSQSAIVLDDPVSSLDHMRRSAIADRLVEEARRRQVIVFTHDLAFLFDLARAVKDSPADVHVGYSSIARGPDKIGICKSEAPFKARAVVDVLKGLKQKLGNERRFSDQGDTDQWRETVKSIATTVRDCWENAVEEVVRHVLSRLQSKVNIPGLVKLTVLQTQDCAAASDGFGRCSELLHTAAPTLNQPLPTPEALAAEIDALDSWTKSIEDRQASARLH